MASAVLRDKQSMNGLGQAPPSSAQLKPRSSQEGEVVRKKSRPRDGEPLQQSKRKVVVFKDSRTTLILKHSFCHLRMKDIQEVEREVIRFSTRCPEDGKVVKNVSRLIVEFITETEQISLNLETFSQQAGWNLHSGNVYTEFSKVATDTFKSAVNWGRIIMFLGFAVSFTVYLENHIMMGSAESVLQWTCQVVEEDIGEFISAHGGWEGFADYLETALRATRRSPPKKSLSSTGSDQQDGTNREDNKSSIWNGAFAAGAVAVGAMAALTLRQAFS